MKKFNLIDSIKNVFFNMLGITMAFGWIIAIVLFSLFENSDFSIPLIIYIVLILIISLTMEINELGKKISTNYNEIETEKSRLRNAYKEQVNKLNYKKNQIDVYYDEKKKYADNYFDLKQKEFKKIIEDEKINKPYLASIYADYQEFIDLQISNSLINKKNPAIKASEEVKKMAKEKRDLLNRLKIIEHQNIIYENAFPWLEEFKEISDSELLEILDVVSEDEYDRAKNYLSPDEYNNLPQIEKYQLWLDRYRNSKTKTKWQIGIDFERYVGYKYEIDGYKLIYNGAREGLEDFGRDLIATKGNEILIIQCKYWSKEKTIHEKHIFQLYGTMILKSIEEKNKKIKGIFVCTNELSETAKQVAKRLGIEVLENFEYDKNYPCIKCNISKKDGSKIYHLPFDQQYDRIDIEVSKGECYASSIKEAEQLGFRKAMRHNNYD